MKTIPPQQEPKSSEAQELQPAESNLGAELAEISREAQIDAIMKANRERLERYVLESDYDYDIGNIPEDVLQAFIPRKIYERSINPANVQIKRAPDPEEPDGPKELSVVVFEKPYPRKAANSGKFKVIQNLRNQVGANARIYLYLSAYNYSNPKALEVGLFEDNSGMRGEGLTTDFYKNLEQVARELGFVYVWGSNTEENLEFFIHKLGRKRIKDLPQSEYNTYFRRSIYGSFDRISKYHTCKDLREM